jgi:hypothetical protein
VHPISCKMAATAPPIENAGDWEDEFENDEAEIGTKKLFVDFVGLKKSVPKRRKRFTKYDSKELTINTTRRIGGEWGEMLKLDPYSYQLPDPGSAQRYLCGHSRTSSFPIYSKEAGEQAECQEGASYRIRKGTIPGQDLARLKSKLHVRPDGEQPNGMPKDGFNVFYEDKDYIYVPRWYGKFHFRENVPASPDLEYEEKLPNDTKFIGKIRKGRQANCIAALRRANAQNRGGIIVVPPGNGKTVIAMEHIVHVGVKTLVVVHKEVLVNQWKSRLEQFVTGIRVGTLRGGKNPSVDNYDVVITTIQSLSSNKCGYTSSMLRSFGHVVYDEAHRAVAKVFMGAIAKVPARVVTALTATPDRKDGLGYVLSWAVGEVLYRAIRPPHTVAVRVVRYESPEFQQVFPNHYGNPDCTRMMTRLLEDPNRIALVVSIIVDLIAKGRTVLVLGERVQHLLDMKVALRKWADQVKHPLRIGECTGRSKKQVRENSMNQQVVFATFGTAREGLDNCYLDSMILATSQRAGKTPEHYGNLEQATGRIMRGSENPFEPLVYDIDDYFSIFKNQGNSRRQYYRLCDYPVRFEDDYDTSLPDSADGFVAPWAMMEWLTADLQRIRLQKQKASKTRKGGSKRGSGKRAPRAPSAYTMFLKAHPVTDKEKNETGWFAKRSKRMGARWKTITAEEKATYVEQARTKLRLLTIDAN